MCPLLLFLLARAFPTPEFCEVPLRGTTEGSATTGRPHGRATQGPEGPREPEEGQKPRDPRGRKRSRSPGTSRGPNPEGAASRTREGQLAARGHAARRRGVATPRGQEGQTPRAGHPEVRLRASKTSGRHCDGRPTLPPHEGGSRLSRDGREGQNSYRMRCWKDEAGKGGRPRHITHGTR